MLNRKSRQSRSGRCCQRQKRRQHPRSPPSRPPPPPPPPPPSCCHAFIAPRARPTKDVRRPEAASLVVRGPGSVIGGRQRQHRQPARASPTGPARAVTAPVARPARTPRSAVRPNCRTRDGGAPASPVRGPGPATRMTGIEADGEGVVAERTRAWTTWPGGPHLNLKSVTAVAVAWSNIRVGLPRPGRALRRRRWHEPSDADPQSARGTLGPGPARLWAGPQAEQGPARMDDRPAGRERRRTHGDGILVRTRSGADVRRVCFSRDASTVHASRVSLRSAIGLVSMRRESVSGVISFLPSRSASPVVGPRAASRKCFSKSLPPPVLL